MTRRDLVWRGVGVGAVTVSAVVGIPLHTGQAAVLGLPAFCLALIGIVLIVQGRRVPAALRVERSRHRTLAQAIRERQRDRYRSGNP